MRLVSAEVAVEGGLKEGRGGIPAQPQMVCKMAFYIKLNVSDGSLYVYCAAVYVQHYCNRHSLKSSRRSVFFSLYCPLEYSLGLLFHCS